MPTPKSSLKPLALLFAIAAISGACGEDDAVAPQGMTPLSSVEELETAVGMPDRDYVALTTRIPGFGGMFFDRDGVLTVALTDTAQYPRAAEAANALLEEWGEDARVEGKMHATYDFAQLSRWKLAIRQSTKPLGISYLDADEFRNRVVVGVRSLSPDVRSQLDILLRSYGIPPEAVIVEQVDVAQQTAALTDYVRPLKGGLSIESANVDLDKCTLGLVVSVSYDGGLFGLTAAHCTTFVFAVDTTLTFFQPLRSNSSHYIGYEQYDPDFFTSTESNTCPVNYFCRWSDAALIRLDSGVSASRGYIARLTTSDPVASTLTIDPNNPAFPVFTSTKSYIANAVWEKIGQATGWTYGPLKGVCIDWIPNNGTQYYPCQMFAQAGVLGGDSGASAFTFNSSGQLKWGGIVIGHFVDTANGHDGFVFSPTGSCKTVSGVTKCSGIGSELGPLTVSP